MLAAAIKSFLLDRQPAVCQKKNWLRFTGLPGPLKMDFIVIGPLSLR